MKFGLHYLLSVSESQSASQRYRDTLEQAVRAEGLGFESVWPVEQHFNQMQSALPCPTLLLAAIAARTTTLRLGTAIVRKYSEVLWCAGDGASGSRGVTRRAGCVICGA